MKTSEYYFKSAKYWLSKMVDDVKNRDLAALKSHYNNLGEALSIAHLGRKHGD